MSVMILKKIVIGLLFGCLLSGCVQGVALLGPTYTLVSTGNVYQAGLSYGSSKVVKKITGKTPTENIKSITRSKKKVEEQENHDKFFSLVKNRIEKTSKIIQLANQ